MPIKMAPTIMLTAEFGNAFFDHTFNYADNINIEKYIEKKDLQ